MAKNREKIKDYFGRLTDKSKGESKNFWAEMKGAETSFLKDVSCYLCPY